ncbi:TetR/AcrR family transcriptional regulator [Pseudonocardia aurantiaca]|uniref:TetR/AcrR family transcriptional regulator n=1 Tax=Pseudonocardia aurantiaca TaxID=75290 RepID=A0ABW4FTA2_9PSEU
MVRLTREQSRQRTRERLLAAAADLFTERGVTGTSVEQVAERAGFTRGAFYGNFADRDGLVTELLRLRTERELAEVRALAAGSYGQTRDALAAWHRDRAEHAGDWLRLRTELWLHALRNPAILPAVAERERFARGALADAIARELAERGVRPPADPAFLGLVVHALEDGLLIQRLLCPEGTREEVVVDATDLLLRAFTALAREEDMQ